MLYKPTHWFCNFDEAERIAFELFERYRESSIWVIVVAADVDLVFCYLNGMELNSSECVE